MVHFVWDNAGFLHQDLSFLCSFGAAIDVPVLGGIHSGVEEAKGSENLDSNRVGSNNSNSLEMSRVLPGAPKEGLLGK